MAERRVLVTGAGGFIGSHLVEALVRRGDKVRALVRYNGRGDAGALERLPKEALGAIELVYGDITDPFFARELCRDQEVIFHLAALIAIPYSYVAPRSFFETNTLGTVHLLEAARQGCGRFVQISTSEVYGTARQIPIPETHPLVGQSPYAASKIGADQAAESYRRAFGVPVVTVRPFNTYGTRQSARAIIPTIISQALSSGRVRLGSLSPTRDLSFATDTAAGMISASLAEGAVGEVINLGNAKEISIGDLAKKILALLAEEGVSATLEHDEARLRPKESEVERLCADTTKAKKLLGWAPEVSLDEGLRRVIAYIRQNLDAYKPGTYQR
jgi:NAD dependent epimerase/dehydratase